MPKYRVEVTEIVSIVYADVLIEAPNDRVAKWKGIVMGRRHEMTSANGSSDWDAQVELVEP